MKSMATVQSSWSSVTYQNIQIYVQIMMHWKTPLPFSPFLHQRSPRWPQAGHQHQGALQHQGQEPPWNRKENKKNKISSTKHTWGLAQENGVAMRRIAQVMAMPTMASNWRAGPDLCQGWEWTATAVFQRNLQTKLWLLWNVPYFIRFNWCN